jgi:transposase
VKLTPGQQGDATGFRDVLDAVPQQCPVKRAVADTAFDSDAIRRELAARKIQAVIPPHPTRKRAIPCDRRAYRRRNQVERLVSKLKQFRRIATRYEKLAATFLAFLHLTAAFIMIR